MQKTVKKFFSSFQPEKIFGQNFFQYFHFSNFQNEKKTLNESRARDANLRDKLSITTTKLLPETEEDRKMASMMTRYRDSKCHDDHLTISREKIDSRRIFEHPKPSDTPSTSSGSSGAEMTPSERLKATMKAERDKRINNSFSSGAIAVKRKTDLGIVIKPKKSVISDKEVVPKAPEPPANAISLLAAQYGDSDDSD